ncbi:MAG: isochorismatase family protein [Streptosporangiales bacterium]|nr:isochorismatase family protein [Streptosporangiales bacterium]
MSDLERGWERFLTERDKKVFGSSGYGATAGPGSRPVVVVVDVTYAFCGDRPEPILESVKRWRNSCGEAAWEAMPHIRALVDAAHEQRVPVVYTTGMDYRPDRFDAGRWADKNTRSAETGGGQAPTVRPNDVVADIAPEPRDLVLAKAKPSAFFGTLLEAHLTALRADTLLVCGTTTSGCVRATVVDGFSYNYRMSIIEEATFDRGEASHHMTLFDMHQKYADVIPVKSALDFIGGLSKDLFISELPILAAN